MKRAIFSLLLMLAPTTGIAGEAAITEVMATRTGESWRFDVTVTHADEGWDHYADGWGVYSVDGVLLGYRKLLHPHVNEQPFTRSLTGVTLPAGTTELLIRAEDNIHGAGPTFTVSLPE